MKNTYILAIETSCDDTSVAIVKNGTKIIKNLVSSQIKDFKKKGGVIPELAARLHFENFNQLWNDIFIDTDLNMNDIDVIAVCTNPGMPGSLIVGVAQAKCLALLYNKPLIEVNHLNAHILSCNLEKAPLTYPVIALIVSGGHTEMHYFETEVKSTLLGKTKDDALGEAYDKLAKMLGFEYPGGPIIEKFAKSGHNSIKLKIPFDDDSFNFSYSGLKSEISNQIQKNSDINVEDLCASFQNQTTTHLIRKLKVAQNMYNHASVVVCGGVISNQYLRTRLASEISVINLPILEVANDNAAMIAAAGFVKYSRNDFSPLLEVDIKMGA